MCFIVFLGGRYCLITKFSLQVRLIQGGVVKKILAAKRPILSIQIHFPTRSPPSPLQVHFLTTSPLYSRLSCLKKYWPRSGRYFPITSPISHYKSAFSLQVHFPATSPLSHYKSTLLKAELLKKYWPRSGRYWAYKSTFPLQVHFSHYKSTFSLQVHFPTTSPLY